MHHHTFAGASEYLHKLEVLQSRPRKAFRTKISDKNTEKNEHLPIIHSNKILLLRQMKEFLSIENVAIQTKIRLHPIHHKLPSRSCKP